MTGGDAARAPGGRTLAQIRASWLLANAARLRADGQAKEEALREIWEQSTRRLIRHHTGSMSAYDMSCGCGECSLARELAPLARAALAAAAAAPKEPR